MTIFCKSKGFLKIKIYSFFLDFSKILKEKSYCRMQQSFLRGRNVSEIPFLTTSNTVKQQ